MSSVPWSNETERADYYQKLFEEQLAICDRLQEYINTKLSGTVAVIAEYDELIKETRRL